MVGPGAERRRRLDIAFTPTLHASRCATMSTGATELEVLVVHGGVTEDPWDARRFPFVL